MTARYRSRKSTAISPSWQNLTRRASGGRDSVAEGDARKSGVPPISGSCDEISLPYMLLTYQDRVMGTGSPTLDEESSE